jgi:hypothetical protein
MENEINIQSEPTSRSTTIPTRIMIKLQKYENILNLLNSV